MSLAALQKVAKAQASKGGNHVKDGKYRFAIENVLCKETSEGDCIIVELRVVTAEKTEAAVEPNPVNSSCSCVWNLTKHKSAAGNAKAFVLGVFGQKEDEVSEEEFLESLKEIISDKQPLRGLQVDDETYRKTIKKGENAGKPITLHKWTEVPGQKPEEIAARRAAIDKAAKDAA